MPTEKISLSHVFIDHSNVWGGARLASRIKNPKLSNQQARIRVSILDSAIQGSRRGINTKIVCGGIPPGMEGLWAEYRNHGYDTQRLFRDENWKERGVDHVIIGHIWRLIAIKADAPSTLVLVSGDGKQNEFGSSFREIIIELLSKRKGELVEIKSENNHTRLEFKVPTRGLLGFRSDFIIETKGEGILTHAFVGYEEYKGEIPHRTRGSLISGENDSAMAYSLWKLEERGRLFIRPQTAMYEGMIIGECAKENDLVVNAAKNKKLTNVRASGTDEAIRLTPIQDMTLERALEYIGDDEYVEITPQFIRLRKKYLTEVDRKRNKS
mgnify:CR=1 FL=1